MAFFPLGIWLVYKSNMPTTYFTVFIFPAAFLMDRLFPIFVFALQSVWEERDICISAPSVGILFQGFKPPDPYFASLVIQTDIGISWVAMDSTKLYLSSESKNIFVCQCTSLLFNCSLCGWWGEGRWLDALTLVTHDIT